MSYPNEIFADALSDPTRREERFRALFDQVPVGIAQFDLTGRFELANPRFCEMVGYAAAEMAALRYSDLTHPGDLTASTDAFLRVAAGGPTANLEQRSVRKDGSILWASNTFSLVRDSVGNPVCLCVVSVDISAQRQADNELHRAKEVAEAANKAKDQFLAVLSHELRTPLMPVLAIVSSLEQQADLPRDVRADLEVVRRNVELETRLIDDLLDLTRITKGKLQLTLETVDVREIVNRVMEICRDDIDQKKLHLLVDLPARGCHVRADSARLQQILWNLVKNAIKFTPAGGKISLMAACLGDIVRVQVADTGVGIEPSAMPRVFEAFEQVHAQMSHRFGGLGLGLSISKALAEAHRGRLFASSEGVNRGATFTLELPTTHASDVAPEPPPASPAADIAGVATRILLVEDHVDTANIMQRLLKNEHHEVEWAATVAAALERASAGQFDLVISDLGLPDGSGLDLMRELRARSDIKGIALSGYGMEDDLRRSRAAGFDEHLIKPINLPALRGAIARVLENP